MHADINFSSPTRIQQAAIPMLLMGRDALVNAPTGSGKTLAYLAPIIHDLQVKVPLPPLGAYISGFRVLLEQRQCMFTTSCQTHDI